MNIEIGFGPVWEDEVNDENDDEDGDDDGEMRYGDAVEAMLGRWISEYPDMLRWRDGAPIEPTALLDPEDEEDEWEEDDELEGDDEPEGDEMDIEDVLYELGIDINEYPGAIVDRWAQPYEYGYDQEEVEEDDVGVEDDNLDEEHLGDANEDAADGLD